MTSSLTFIRSWLPFAYDTNYTLRLEFGQLKFEPVNFLTFCDKILKELVPVELTTGKTIQDVKGKNTNNINNIIEVKNPAQFKPLERDSEELLFIAGKTYQTRAEPLNNEANNQESEEIEPEPFKLGIYSKFKEFIGTHAIVHSLSRVCDHELLQDTPIKDLTNTFPLEIEYLRLNLEFFERTFTVSSLGYVPIVNKYFSLETDKNELNISIRYFTAKKSASLPVFPRELIERLKIILFQELNFDLVKDFQDQSVFRK